MIKLLLGASSSIRYVGSVTAGKDRGVDDWVTSGDALDVLSVASAGDLVVIAFTFEGGADSSWSWVGMPFTTIYDLTGNSTYVGYRVVESGDTNPYVSGITTGGWRGLSIVAAVFRAASYVSFINNNDNTGMPNPPSLTATGSMCVATGHLKGSEGGTWTAPSGYSLAGYQNHTYVAGAESSGTGIAYKKGRFTSIDPGAFGGSGDDTWFATTIALS